MENTLENKAKFFALYFGQKIAKSMSSIHEVYYVNQMNIERNTANLRLYLSPLSQITDEDLEYVARLAHERPNLKFNIERNGDIFYATSDADKVGIYYFISMMPKYGTVCATMNFNKTETREHFCHTINIGKINLSSARPLAYVAIVDFLRSKGYAMPFMGISVDKLAEYGWIEFTPQIVPIFLQDRIEKHNKF